MSNAHRRKKDPAHVRAQLMESAAKMAIDHGLSSISVDAVSAAAGVTRGGFFHHFPNKQSLISAVFNRLLEDFGATIESQMASDPEPHGRYTRAYVELAFAARESQNALALWKSIILDSEFNIAWAEWQLAFLARQGHFENSTSMVAARFAADGICLSDAVGATIPDRPALKAYLLSKTVPPV
ncbi:TetR/AcrR family transcriptional regulator [Rhizobium leguminosarum]|uniref:TetR/AcrR family transcriptional regulator n=2 Tax=Rhizobium leguminosarum TaxID=384 RepID=UPI0010409111|nr:TetR/AcrR family transcriptional regulator [Rhizobium leguminosarum bv. viciae]TBZ26647.1 TetR/AcrR family transcriptional regulator [Rhizobium leguminosarum bv. viciae]